MRRLIRTIGARLMPALVFVLLAVPALAAPEDEIRTLLPKDGIPSIDDPKFATAKEADKFMKPDEMVIGVNIGGDRRAYSVPLLSSHEIVNDVVGGRKIAVTW
jgi:hypothetical protein